MMRIENECFENFEDRSTGSSFSDLEFVNCRFIQCGFSTVSFDKFGKLDFVALRSIARQVVFQDCRIEGVGFIGSGIVEDSTVDGLRVSNHLQTKGTVFKHVIVRGLIDKFMVTPYVDIFGEYHGVQGAFDQANRAYYKGVDWALDISEAVFKDCDIRAIPSQLIRRDPETQVVLTREKALLSGINRLHDAGIVEPD